MTLTTHHLEFTASATTPLELDDQAGGAIRGALVGGLWERFCANRAAPSCATSMSTRCWRSARATSGWRSPARQPHATAARSQPPPAIARAPRRRSSACRAPRSL